MLLPVGKYFQKKPHTSSHWLKPAGVISSYYLVVYLAPHMYSNNLLPGASEVGGMGVFIPPMKYQLPTPLVVGLVLNGYLLFLFVIFLRLRCYDHTVLD